MIEPNKWFALMRAAQRRNEDPIWEDYKGLGTKRELYAEVGEDLEFAHNAAVEKADIVAEKAYIKAFHATYEKTQKEVYDQLAPPSLAAHYRREDRPPDPPSRIRSAGIDPNKWYALMCNAQNRNEELFWRALQPLRGKDLNKVDELLDRARAAAVEAANLAAELAYIRAFNKVYDKQHQANYERPEIRALLSQIIHSEECRKSVQRPEKSSATGRRRESDDSDVGAPAKRGHRLPREDDNGKDPVTSRNWSKLRVGCGGR